MDQPSAWIDFGKAFGVSGLILFALFFAGWKLLNRIWPRVEQAFDDHHELIQSMREALNQFGARMTVMDERSRAHGDQLDAVSESVLRIEQKIAQ
jgi:hypothetical protein